MNKEELDQQTIDGLGRWLIDNVTASSSTIRGQTASDLGYVPSDLSKIQIGFNIEHGTDEIKIFYQKSDETRGRTFEVTPLDDSMFEILENLYQNIRANRRKKNTRLDSMLGRDTMKQKLQKVDK